MAEAVILVSEGLIELPEFDSIDALKNLLERHISEACDHPNGFRVHSGGNGAFVTMHGTAHVREEQSFRGHIYYLMTESERVSDEAAWADLDFAFLLPG